MQLQNLQIPYMTFFILINHLRHFLLNFIVFSLITVNVSAQFVQISSGTIKTLRDIEILENGVFIAGGKGIIIRSVDSSLSWTTVSSGYNHELYEIKFLDSLNGRATGDNVSATSGTIWFSTDDGGIRWEEDYRNNPPTKLDARGMTMRPNGVGYVVGTNTASACGSGLCPFKISRTTDSGRTFVDKDFPIFTNNIDYSICVDFLTDNIGVAAGTSGQIHATIDGGDNWFSRNIPGQSFARYNDINILNDSTVFVVAYKGINAGLIGHTLNGGNTWETILTDEPINRMSFMDDQNAYVVGDNGLVLKTTDGGENWIAVNSGTNKNLYGIAHLSDSVIYIVGEDGLILTNLYENINQIEVAFTPSTLEPICEGETVNFTNETTNGTNFRWYFNDSLFSTDSNTSFTFTNSGSHTIKLVADDVDNTAISDSVTTIVNVILTPNASFTYNNDTFIINDSIADTLLLTNTSTDALAGRTYYLWSLDGDTLLYTMQDTFITYVITDASRYDFRLIVMPASNPQCKDTASLSVYGIKEDTTEIDTTTFIRDNYIQTIFIYPNPTTGKFSIEIPDVTNSIQLEIYNSVGLQIYLQRLQAKKRANIDLENVATGIYLVRMVGEEYVWQQQIIIRE